MLHRRISFAPGPRASRARGTPDATFEAPMSSVKLHRHLSAGRVNAVTVTPLRLFVHPRRSLGQRSTRRMPGVMRWPDHHGRRPQNLHRATRRSVLLTRIWAVGIPAPAAPRRRAIAQASSRGRPDATRELGHTALTNRCRSWILRLGRTLPGNFSWAVRVLSGPGRFGRMRRSPWRRWSSSYPCGRAIRRPGRRGHRAGGRSWR